MLANSITKQTSQYLTRPQLKRTSLSLTQTPLQGTVRNQVFMVSEGMPVKGQYPYCASMLRGNILCVNTAHACVLGSTFTLSAFSCTLIKMALPLSVIMDSAWSQWETLTLRRMHLQSLL